MSTCLFHSLFIYNSCLSSWHVSAGSLSFPSQELGGERCQQSGQLHIWSHFPAPPCLMPPASGSEGCWNNMVLLNCQCILSLYLHGGKALLCLRGEKVYFKSIILSVCQIAWVMYF